MYLYSLTKVSHWETEKAESNANGNGKDVSQKTCFDVALQSILLYRSNIFNAYFVCINLWCSQKNTAVVILINCRGFFICGNKERNEEHESKNIKTF